MLELLKSWALLLRDNSRLIVACTMFMFVSTIGQTYLISQFLPFFQAKLQVTQTTLGSTYSLGTFVSSLCLFYVGSLFDRKSLNRFSLAAAGVFSLGLIFMSLATNIYLLFLGFYFTRLIGQTTFSLISTNIVIQTMGINRGKALSLIQFGRGIGESFFPFYVISLSLSWGSSIVLISLVLILLFTILLALFLLRDINLKEEIYPVTDEQNLNKSSHNSKFCDWKTIKNDFYFYAAIIANCSLPFVMTGLFFQQQSLLDFTQWSQLKMGKAFVAMASSSVLVNLITGQFIDIVGAIRLRVYILVPLLLAMALVFIKPSENFIYLYMFLIGSSIGISGNVQNAYWAERYGVSHLGKIKGMNYSFMVFSTSLAPFLFSFIMDKTQNFLILLIMCCMAALVGQLLNTLLRFKVR